MLSTAILIITFVTFGFFMVNYDHIYTSNPYAYHDDGCVHQDPMTPICRHKEGECKGQKFLGDRIKKIRYYKKKLKREK